MLGVLLRRHPTLRSYMRSNNCWANLAGRPGMLLHWMTPEEGPMGNQVMIPIVHPDNYNPMHDEAYEFIFARLKRHSKDVVGSDGSSEVSKQCVFQFIRWKILEMIKIYDRAVLHNIDAEIPFKYWLPESWEQWQLILDEAEHHVLVHTLGSSMPRKIDPNF